MDRLKEATGFFMAESFIYQLCKAAVANKQDIITREDVESDAIICEDADLVDRQTKAVTSCVRVPTWNIVNRLNKKVTKDAPQTNLQRAFSGWKQNAKFTVQSVNEFIRHEKLVSIERQCLKTSKDNPRTNLKKIAWGYLLPETEEPQEEDTPPKEMTLDEIIQDLDMFLQQRRMSKKKRSQKIQAWLDSGLVDLKPEKESYLRKVHAKFIDIIESIRKA